MPKAEDVIRERGLKVAAEHALAPLVSGERISAEDQSFAREVYRRLKEANARTKARKAARAEREAR